jgi:hypothetical protein
MVFFPSTQTKGNKMIALIALLTAIYLALRIAILVALFQFFPLWVGIVVVAALVTKGLLRLVIAAAE